MDRYTCQAGLAAQNEMLRQEVRVAREAAEITADFVIHQFEETEYALERMRAANVYLNALHETSLGLIGRLELTELLRTIVDRAAALVGTTHGYICLLEPDGEVMIQRVGIGAMAGNVGLRIEMGEGLAGRTWQSGQSQVIENYSAWAGRLAAYEDAGLQAVMNVPLKSGSEIVGVIGLALVEQERRFTSEEIDILDRFAVLATVAMNNALLYAEVQRELAERQQAQQAEREQRLLAETLQASIAALTKSLDLESGLETMLDYLAQLVPYDSASVMLLKDESYLEIRAARGFEQWTSPSLIVGHTFDARSSIALAQVLETRSSFLVADTYQTEGWERPPGTEYIRSWLGVPLISDDEVIGVYCMDKAEVDFFTADHANLAEMLAAHGVVAIQNARLLRDVRASNERLQGLVTELEALQEIEHNQRVLAEAISETTAMLNSSLDTRDVFEGILTQVDKVVPAEASSLLLIVGDLVEVAHVRGHDPGVVGLRIPFEQPNFQQSVVTRRPVVIADTRDSDSWVATDATSWIRSSVTVSIVVGEDIIGFLSIDSKDVDAFSVEHIQGLQTFADQAALAVRNARLFAEVQNEKQYSESIVQNSPVAIITSDGQSRVQSWNPAAERLFGYTVNEASGQNLDILVSNQEMSAEARRFSKETLKGSAVRTVTQRCRKDGRLIDVEVLSICADAAEPDAGYIAIYHDITELKEAEAKLEQAKVAAEAANQAKSSFLANMSHELRTPLNAIIGYSEMLAEEFEDEELDDFIPDLQKIRSAGKHLLALINDVLDLSKIEAGKMELFLETFDIGALIEGVVDTARPLVEKNGNQFDIQLPHDPGMMRADQTKVRQSLLNLLSNAAKFTENGSVFLNVERQRIEGHDWISMRVSDSGIGMTSDQIGKLFQAFSQAENSTSRKYGGTGLGLDISRRFCRLMGGDITVESDYGSGSTFTIVLPLEVKDKEPEKVEVERPSAGSKQAGATKVLVVDDDPAVRDLMQRFLTKEGFQVEIAANGEEGVLQAKEMQPDVITLDVLMPGMDGWEVIAKLKSDPETAEIPVVMVSIMDNRNLGYALGVAEYLTKPVDRERLLSVLTKYRRTYPSPDVLVVEDDVATRELLRKIIEGKGWTVSEAENGKIALALMADWEPSLILLDLMMPEMDGFKFVTEIRSCEKWQDIPVVVITARDLTPDDRQLLKGNVQKILEKGSYSRDELLEEVHNLVNESVG